MSRAIRRHHVARLKKARKQYWGYNHRHANGRCEDMPAKQLGMVVSTPAVCSCWMCGNGRKIHGPNFQELCLLQGVKED